jgi:hypothetical protein
MERMARGLRATRGLRGRLLGALVLVALLAGCMPGSAARPTVYRPTWTPPPTPLANIVVGALQATATLVPTAAPTQPRADEGLQATLANYQEAVGASDPQGAKYNAFQTLKDFVDPLGRYASAWWFRDDGQGDVYEAIAVILYTEGNTNWDVRTAVSARYLWYCGGAGTHCQGHELIDFLSYFQPWREPWMARGFTSDNAAKYEEYAHELVDQKPGLLTTLIPGADTYVHDAEGLSSASSINWQITPFHFANVDPTWDTYLRQRLRRSPNGAARLWVLTIAEAGRVCVSQFLCQDMTQPRK